MSRMMTTGVPNTPDPLVVDMGVAVVLVSTMIGEARAAIAKSNTWGKVTRVVLPSEFTVSAISCN